LIEVDLSSPGDLPLGLMLYSCSAKGVIDTETSLTRPSFAGNIVPIKPTDNNS
jgi:hypothetical protein